MEHIPPTFNVETEDYTGPNRREHCGCHIKHDKVLQDHTDDIKEIKADRTRRREIRTVEHADMWNGIKDKVEKKLFYFMVASILTALGFVYNGIHEVDKAVAVLNNAMELHFSQAVEIKRSIQKVDDKVERHIHQTTNGHSKPNTGGKYVD